MGTTPTDDSVFSTDITGPDEAGPTDVVELADGDTYELRVSSLVKRIGDDRVPMPTYNGPGPGPTLRVRERSASLQLQRRVRRLSGDILSTPPRRSTTLNHVAFAVVIAVLLAACGGNAKDADTRGEATPTTTAPATSAPATTVVRPSATIDELVAVDGARLHVRCSGAGDATVVLIAGLGSGVDVWAAVQPTVSGTTRVCAYDRFGTGTSDPPPAPQTFATQAQDLHTLLASIGEPSPYVLVGHSFGGAEAVTFASLYPDDVKGLLLLDATPVGWNTAVCGVTDDGSPAAQRWQDACAMQADPANNPEHVAGPAAFAEVATVNSLGDLPMIVATAPAREDAAGLAPSDVAALNAAWNSGQDHWVSLSSAARRITVADTGHFIQIDQPGVVIDQIAELL